MVADYDSPTTGHGRIQYTATSQPTTTSGSRPASGICGARVKPSPRRIAASVTMRCLFLTRRAQEAANQLIDQVKYQQMVQWLGENPYRVRTSVRANSPRRRWEFLFLSLKASGLALVSCLGVGGFFGALLFRSTARSAARQGSLCRCRAMLRLNLDELTPRILTPARLARPQEANESFHRLRPSVMRGLAHTGRLRSQLAAENILQRMHCGLERSA